MGKTSASILTALVMLVGVFAQTALAGGIDNKQDWSARYLATGSRNAATDGVDIAAYNPAGMMFQEDGIGLGLDVHYIFKNYEHKYTDLQAGPVTRDQDEPSIVPGLFATYKSGVWGVFGSITNNGGGGEVKYESGNAITNTIAMGFFPLPLTNQFIEAESMYITYTAGASYQINPMVSVAAGIRYMDANKDVSAYSDTALGALYGAYEEEADGWGWIASMNVKLRNDLLLAFRYESEVDLEFETTLDGNNTAMGNAVLAGLGKTQNGTYDRNLPAVFGMGVSWDANDRLNLNTSFTYYLEKRADWDGEEDLVDNSYDIAISATYSFMDNLRGSIGYMFTDVGIDAKDFTLVEQMSPALDAHSFFLGLGYDFSERITFDLGLMTNFYDEDTALDRMNRPVTYEKQNNAVAMGVAFKF
ncbi:MAG: outer membrane protein transport protein [Desulfotignum balticum]|jgi:long-chain fatty acid transport protein|uniref:Outer membrane protein transport protein n=1 Tax=Desulfotignum balticum TaxID=115781 RepID=A0A931CSH2_9BACT|nr:outer membrane protein transport protein [Desulfotignum balticum]